MVSVDISLMQDVSEGTSRVHSVLLTTDEYCNHPSHVSNNANKYRGDDARDPEVDSLVVDDGLGH